MNQEKSEKQDNFILGLTIIIIINLLGFYLYSKIGQVNRDAQKYTDIVKFEENCSIKKLTIIRHNGFQPMLYCVSKEEISNFLTKNDLEDLLNWFSN